MGVCIHNKWGAINLMHVHLGVFHRTPSVRPPCEKPCDLPERERCEYAPRRRSPARGQRAVGTLRAVRDPVAMRGMHEEHERLALWRVRALLRERLRVHHGREPACPARASAAGPMRRARERVCAILGGDDDAGDWAGRTAHAPSESTRATRPLRTRSASGRWWCTDRSTLRRYVAAAMSAVLDPSKNVPSWLM